MMASARSLRYPFAVAVVTVLVLAAAVATYTKTFAERPSTGSVRPPINMAMSFDRVVFDTPAAMCHSDLVIDTLVVGRGPGHWTTVDGLRPSADTRGHVSRGYMIVTPLKFGSSHVVRDRRLGATSEIVVPGGQAGQDRITSDLAPVLVGQRYLLVAVPGVDPRTNHWSERSMMVLDAFPIDRSGMVTLRPQLVEQGQVSQSSVRMALGDLRAQLASC